MPIFAIPVSWECAGTMFVEADTLEDAENKAIEDEPLPDGEYITDSTQLDKEHSEYGKIQGEAN